MTVSSHIPNHQVVAIAVLLLGGDKRYVDTEDVAVKVNQIAPGRHTWRKYSEQINLELIRVYLSDAKKKSKGEILEGSGNQGWKLTARGKELIEPLARKFADQPVLSNTQADLRRAENEKLRLLSSEAYAKFMKGEINSISAREADAFFRVDEYVDAKTRLRKVSRILELFADDPDLGKLAIILAEKVKSDE